MINLFDFAANDQSLKYLAQLFGNMSGAIPITGDSYSAGTVLGAMFQTFNSIVLAVGAMIIVYSTVVGVLNTAHEGQFMGKNWNNLWIPIRTVLGVACLIPSGSGFSAIQWILMWIIVQGVGAGDTMWSTVLKYITITGSPYTSISIPAVSVNTSMNQLFQAVTCDETARRSDRNPYVDGAGDYYCYNKPLEGPCARPAPNFDPNNPTMLFGPEGACGKMTHCVEAVACGGTNNAVTPESDEIKCLACKGELTALANIIPTFRSVANLLVDLDYQYTSFWVKSKPLPRLPGFDNLPPPPPTPVPEFIQKYCTANNITACNGANLPNPAPGTQNLSKSVIYNVLWPDIKEKIGDTSFMKTSVTYFIASVSDGINEYIKRRIENPNQVVDKKFRDAEDNGWILAGAYYYTIAQMTGSNVEASLPDLTIIGGDPQAQQMNVLRKNRNNYDAAARLVAAANGATSKESAFEGAIPGGGAISETVDSSMASVSKAFANNVKDTGGGSNPIAELVATGTLFIKIAQLLVVGITIVTAWLASVGFFSVYFVGTGFDNPVGPAMATLYMILVPILLSLVATLISFGGLLAIYIPLVPYVIFTFGAISWLLSTIEAMVAAPLVALGILSPTAQGHEILGKSENAIMMIFAIFLRPSLMIFGLMSAMLMVWVVKGMIDAAYFKIVWGSLAATAWDPVSIILMIGSYVFLIIAAYNKCFQAIYLIPNQVLSWIGGHHAARDGGEAQALGEVKTGQEKVGSATASGASKAGGLGKDVGEKRADADKKQEDAAARKKLHNTTTPDKP